MSVKKNLTIAGLAALLVVPAFNSTNISHNLHIPSVAAHADSSNISNPGYWYNTGTSGNVYLTRTLVAKNVYQNPKGDYLNRVTGTTVFPKDDYVHIVSQGTNGIDLNISDSSHPINNSSTTLYSIPQSDATAFSATNTDGNSSQSSNNSNNTEHGNSANKENNGPSQSSNNSDSSISNNNNSTQYASKNSLPQTGEVNHQASELAASIVLGATSVGLGAMSMRKHKRNKDVASATPIQTNSSSNNGNNKVNNIINTLNSNANKLSNLVHRMSNK